jgi:hypothetical protein
MAARVTPSHKAYSGKTWTFYVDEHTTENDDNGNRISTQLVIFDDAALSEFSLILDDRDRVALIEALSKGVPGVRKKALRQAARKAGANARTC